MIIRPYKKFVNSYQDIREKACQGVQLYSKLMKMDDESVEKENTASIKVIQKMAVYLSLWYPIGYYGTDQ